jgi:hypothetical protein
MVQARALQEPARKASGKGGRRHVSLLREKMTAVSLWKMARSPWRAIPERQTTKASRKSV